MDVNGILRSFLANLDEDILSYIISVVDDLSLIEKKSAQTLQEIISPYLLDSNFVNTEEEANDICQKISVQFGGSGLNNRNVTVEEALPILLSAPVKMNDLSTLKPVKKTYGGAILHEEDSGFSNVSGSVSLSSNTQYDSSSIPTTAKQMRRQKKVSEQLARAIFAENLLRAAQAAEQSKARMTAILASRNAGRQGLTGVNLDRFSLAHPSGTGDLLTDVSLTMTPGRRYGLIGRNGAGKSTLLRVLANYQLEGLNHLRILLVDQHVEGDDDSAMQWVLRSDVERTALLEQEIRLNTYLHTTDTSLLPPDLKNVNIELALTECYERMDAISISTSEQRARKILLALGFTDKMMLKPTNELSGGWAMRAALAAAVYIKPTLLLLDEPTNHLDLHALVWLEDWLINHYDGMLLVVSHDRYFLNDICTDILELRSLLAGQKKSSLEQYSGKYIFVYCILFVIVYGSLQTMFIIY